MKKIALIIAFGLCASGIQAMGDETEMDILQSRSQEIRRSSPPSRSASKSPSGLSLALLKANENGNSPLQSPRTEYGLKPGSAVEAVFKTWAFQLETAYRKVYYGVPVESFKALTENDWIELKAAVMKKHTEEFEKTKKIPPIIRKNNNNPTYTQEQQRVGLTYLISMFMRIEKVIRKAPVLDTADNDSNPAASTSDPLSLDDSDSDSYSNDDDIEKDIFIMGSVVDRQ